MNADNLIERVNAEGHPLVDGTTVTFVWQGGNEVHLIDDLHGWESEPQPLVQITEDVWTFSFDLPPKAYLEYAFIDPDTGERYPDPLNKRKVWNGINAHNHFFYMPGNAATLLARRSRNVPQGTVSRQTVETRMLAVGAMRRIDLYRPPVDGPVPLLVVFDGTDYLRRGKLVNIVDNLIAQKRIQPLAMALLQNAGQARLVEYGGSEATLAFLHELVLPLAREQLDLLDIEKHNGAYGVMGASMGGLMALYTGLRLPEIFGRVLSQSGAFHLWEYETTAVELVRHAPQRELRIWMDVGLLEWLLESNRSMHALLDQRGFDVTYREFPGGHNYTSWRDDAWRGLESLFGGK